MKIRFTFSVIFFLAVLLSDVRANELIIGTTTSTKSSGLLDKLIPAFEESSGLKVMLYTVGTGKALRMARQGKVDVLLVHAPKAEKKFIKDGFGISRTPIMKNDFVIVGPKSDPAGIFNLHDASASLTKIHLSKSLFVSRADDSGTHKKELSIWETSNIEPYGDWYFELGAGMGQTLNVANDKQAYLLIDRGTWLAKRKQVSLVLHVEGDALLDNPYSVIAINPKRHRNVSIQGAKKFIKWITSSHGKEIINALKVDGEKLYTVTSK